MRRGDAVPIEDLDDVGGRVVFAGDEPRRVRDVDAGVAQPGADRRPVEHLGEDPSVGSAGLARACTAVQRRGERVVRRRAPVAAQQHEGSEVRGEAHGAERAVGYRDLLLVGQAGEPAQAVLLGVDLHGRRDLGFHRAANGRVQLRRGQRCERPQRGERSEGPAGSLGEGEGRQWGGLRVGSRCPRSVDRVVMVVGACGVRGIGVGHLGDRRPWIDDHRTGGDGLALERCDPDRESEETGEPDGLVVADRLEVATEALGADVDAEDRLRSRRGWLGRGRRRRRGRWLERCSQRAEQVIPVAELERLLPDGEPLDGLVVPCGGRRCVRPPDVCVQDQVRRRRGRGAEPWRREA